MPADVISDQLANREPGSRFESSRVQATARSEPATAGVSALSIR
jgi:hypothetical protein